MALESSTHCNSMKHRQTVKMHADRGDIFTKLATDAVFRGKKRPLSDKNKTKSRSTQQKQKTLPIRKCCKSNIPETGYLMSVVLKKEQTLFPFLLHPDCIRQILFDICCEHNLLLLSSLIIQVCFVQSIRK